MGVVVPARGMSTVLLLDEAGPLGIMEIAERIRFSHPLVIRLTKDLEDAGVVHVVGDPADRRRRLIELTPTGRGQAEAIRAASRVITAAYQALSAEIGVDLLAMVEHLEAAGDRLPFPQRLRDLAGRMSRNVEA